jgi:hypothetical protein
MTIETATNKTQDITSRIEAALDGEHQVDESDAHDDQVVPDDANELPEGDDTYDQEEEGSEDKADDEDESDESDDSDKTLADYLGVEDDRIIVNDKGEVHFKAIIDGESKSVPLSELAKSYQLQGHVNNQSIALANERKSFETGSNLVKQELVEQLQANQQMAQLIESELIGEFNGINWDELRSEDPTKWSLMRQDFADKAHKIQTLKSKLDESGRSMYEQQQKISSDAQSQYINEQRAKMIEENPTWGDPEVFKTEMTGIRDFLNSNYGFTSNELDQVSDYRLIKLSKDIKELSMQKKASSTVVKKKVAKIPKFQKPGSGKNSAHSTSKARAVKAKRSAVTKSGGDVASVANFILDRM